MHLVDAFIPSPSHNGFYLGPLFVHAYGLMYVLAVTAAILITRRRWARAGGDPDLAYRTAIVAFPAGLIGGRIYFLVTTPSQVPDHWWGPFAIWQGGLGIWGGVAAGAAAAIWYLRRRLPKGDLPRFADAVAPALLVAQAIGRIGNYFNQELFGAPSKLPWALKIAPAHRPPGYLHYATFEPTFLYELTWNLLLASFIVWLGHHRRIKTPGLFALYVAGYSAFRVFEETQRIDYSVYVLGMRLNFWISLLLCAGGLAWFAAIQRGVALPTPALDHLRRLRPQRRQADAPPSEHHRSAPSRPPTSDPAAPQADSTHASVPDCKIAARKTRRQPHTRRERG